MFVRFQRMRFPTLALIAVFAALPLAAVHGNAQSSEPSLEIVSPASGAVITTDQIAVELTVENFTVDCTQAGRTNADGIGHIHAMLDGMTMGVLTNFYCGASFSISGAGLVAGQHTLVVDFATNDHLDLMDTAKEIEFDYQPVNPQPLPAANDLGEPGVELVSPLDGTTVAPKFTVAVKPVNFAASADLEGKPNVPGYGHYHVFVDTDMAMMDMEMSGTPEAGIDEGEMMATPGEDMGTDEMHMMAMSGMVLMPGTDTFELDLTAWGPGEHVIWIEPVQNDHTTFETFGHAEFRVIIDPNLAS